MLMESALMEYDYGIVILKILLNHISRTYAYACTISYHVLYSRVQRD